MSKKINCNEISVEYKIYERFGARYEEHKNAYFLYWIKLDTKWIYPIINK